MSIFAVCLSNNIADVAIRMPNRGFSTEIAKGNCGGSQVSGLDFDIYHVGTGNRGKPQDFIARDKILDDMPLLADGNCRLFGAFLIRAGGALR